MSPLFFCLLTFYESEEGKPALKLVDMIYGIALLSGFAQKAALSAVMSTITANVVNDFFTHLFLHPENHSIAALAICGSTLAICTGLVFLIKMVYEKIVQAKSPK